MRSPSRRHLLKAGLAAVPAVVLSRLGLGSTRALPELPPVPAYAGFPVPARQWRGDSSVGAALRSGTIPPGSTLAAISRSAVEAGAPQSYSRLWRPDWGALLRPRFPRLKRHFVFEYYPWYATNPYVHWGEKGSVPPYGIASTMMPALGPYDSADKAVIEQHARWLADSGGGSIAISWWGRGSNTDRATPLIMDVMRAHDIHVTFHLEPYANNRALSYASDINYLLREYGERRRWDNFLLLDHADGTTTPVFKTFRTILPPTVVDCLGVTRNVPDYTPDDVWRRQTDAVRENARPLFNRVVLLADSLDLGRTKAGGFDGIAIYDAFVRPSTWPQAAKDFGDNGLVYSFAINCGFDGYVPVIPEGVCDVPQPFEPPVGPIDWTVAASRLKAEAASRARVFESLDTTLELQADPRLGNSSRGFFLTYVTTFNEWHEGTSFEPAKPRAALLPEERPFNYHNPENGAWRLELLKALVRSVTRG